MTTTTKTDEAAARSDVLARLADRGEVALHRLVDLPGGQRAAKAFNDLKERVDELGKKVRGIDELEARVAALELEVAALKPAKPASRPRKQKPPAKAETA